MISAAAQLRALVRAHRPGQIVTRNTLNTALGGGVAGPPNPELLRLLSAAEELTATLTGDPSLRALTYRRGDGRCARRRWTPEEPRRGILDVNNLVWTFRVRAAAQSPQVAPLFEVLRYLRSLSVERLIGIADANLVHTVADANLLPELSEVLDELHTAPAGVPADELILTAAEDAAPQGGALIFSNDLFRQWRKGSAWRRRNIWRIVVPVRPLGSTEEYSAERQFDLGDPGWELCDPPPSAPERGDGTA